MKIILNDFQKQGIKEEEKKKKFDAIILGGGPAGLTAGIYAKRFGLSTLLIEKLGIGGQASVTDIIENYPGFPQGISGEELTKRFEEQAKRFGVEIIFDEIKEIKLTRPIKLISEDNEFEAEGLIIATGADPKKLGVPGEKELTGKGVSYCAVCDAFLFKDKNVLVVGGGDSAITEALYLTKFAKKVYVIHRRDKLRAAKYLQDRAFENDKIEFIWSSLVKEIKGEKRVEGVTIYDKVKDTTWELEIDGVFIYIGLTPNTDLFKGKIELDEKGFIITDEDMRTNVKFVYAAGDVRRKSLRQVITASADGAIAANSLFNDLEG